MVHAMRQILAGFLALLLLVSADPAVLAEENGGVSAAAEETGIIDASGLQQWMDAFAEENSLKDSYKRFSVGFWYSGTGDSWYYDADQWMYSASLYKVPVSMLMAEKEAAGELTQESIVNGTTLQYLESTALIYSNNDSGHSMVSWLGGTYAGKCSDMTIRFTDLPESYFTQDFYDVSYYTARYMTQVMRSLYLGGEEQFPHVLDYLKQAQPDDYFNRDSTLKAGYTIAQKFGAYEEPNGNNNNHCAAVIYTPNPIVVTVMTRNVGDYQNIIAAVGSHLAETALELDQKLEEYRRVQAEQAAQTELAAQAAETVQAAAGDQDSRKPAADQTGSGTDPNQPAADRNAADTEEQRSGTAVTVPAAAEPAAGQSSDAGKNPSRGIPIAVWIIAAVLLATVITAAVLLRRERKDPAEETEEAEPRRRKAGKKTGSRSGPDDQNRRERGQERTGRRTASPGKPAGRKDSDSGYRPRH